MLTLTCYNGTTTTKGHTVDEKAKIEFDQLAVRVTERMLQDVDEFRVEHGLTDEQIKRLIREYLGVDIEDALALAEGTEI